MPTEKPRVTFMISQDQLNMVDSYRFENKFKSQSQAIISLIEKGLSDYEPKIKTAPLYSSEAMEVARVYDTLDDSGKQRLREAAKKEQDIKATMDNLIRNIVVFKMCDEPIVGPRGIELRDEKLRGGFVSITEDIPLKQRKVLIKLRDKQIRRPLGIRFHHPNQDQEDIVFIIDQGVEAAEGQSGLFTMDGKSYLGRVKDGQLFVFPEDTSLGQIHPGIKSEGIMIGYVDPQYICGI